jgi:hypothetical protein
MTTLKTVTIAAALLVGGASLAMAQNGLPTGGQSPVAGGANGGWYPGYGYGYGYATAPQLQPRSTITQPQHTATPLRLIRHRPRRERPILS